MLPISTLSLGLVLALVNTAAVPVVDTHFHPCPFGEANQCVALADMLPEMDKAGVDKAWVFGLQHQLLENPPPIEEWRNASCPLVGPAIFPGGLDPEEPSVERCEEIHRILDGSRPFHYNDPCAKPGWPVAINTRADEWIFSQYQVLPAADKARIKPFLSRLDLDQPCARDDRRVRTNLAYVLAMDKKYPRTVHGFAEHNFNKIVLYTHGSCVPDLDEFARCSRRLMRYIAPSNRPLNIHLDVADIRGKSYAAAMLKFAKKFDDNVLVWVHAGIAPEVSNRLGAREHIRIMEAFLATSPGRRYIELSWWNGFFRRLRADILDTDHFGWPIERDLEQEKALYREFFFKHQDKLLFGSDQVSLFYDELVVDGLKLHAGYDDNYRQEIDKAREALKELIDVQTPQGAALWRALMSGNAERMMNAIDWSAADGER